MSVSAERALSAESRARRTVVRLVATIALLVTVAYLTWRLVDTIAWNVWWVAVPLWLLELHTAIGLFLFTFSLWDLDAATPPEPRTTTDARIAVLIPTYNEPVEVLLPTVASAVALQPAHETWVLDDGSRPDVEALAARLGARYLTRPTHENAKAGNVNHALGLGGPAAFHDAGAGAVKADLVAVLDADHVADAGLLTKTIGYFDDPQVAVVQTPQDFYNTESFEHDKNRSLTARRGRERFNEQALFYRAIQPGKNRWKGAFWCGTNAVVRVSALRAVGGVATDTITEDIHTSVRMHRAGWHTVYHNEVLARGLAATDATQYWNQRVRWGTGAMQLLRSRDNPLVASGLTLGQRLSYAATLLGWFDAWRSLGFVLLPAVVLATGAVPIKAPAEQFVAFFGVSFLLQRLALAFLSRGYAPQGMAVVFDMVRMPSNIAATLALFTNRRPEFSVTAKGRLGDDRRRVRPPTLLVTVAALTIVGLAWFGASDAGLTPLHYGVHWAAYGAAAWAVVNGVLLLVAIARIRSDRFAGERRASVRFPTRLPVDVGRLRGVVTDLSLTGAKLLVPKTADLAVGAEQPLRVVTGGDDLTATVVVRSVRNDGGEQVVGVEFTPGQDAMRAALALLLFRSDTPALVEPEPTTDEPVARPAVVLPAYTGTA